MAASDIELKITVDANGAIRILDKFGKEINKTTQEAERASSGGFSKFQASIVTLQSAISLGGQAFGMLRGAANKLFSTLDRARKVEGLTAGFENLQRSVGALAFGSLGALQESTRGLIADFDLMQSANQAVLLGVDDGSGKFQEMAGAAVKLGEAMGIDAKTAIDSLTIGLGRQSKLMLDNLGVILSVEDANKKWAEANDRTVESMTEQEQKLAFIQAGMDAVAEKAAKLGDKEDTAATAAQRLTVSFKNVTDEFATNLSQSPKLAAALDDIADALDDIDAEQLAEEVANITANFAELAATLVPKVVGAINKTSDAFDYLRKAWNASDPSLGPEDLQPGGMVGYMLGYRSERALQIEKETKLLQEQEKVLTELGLSEWELYESLYGNEEAYAALDEQIVKTTGSLKNNGDGVDKYNAALDDLNVMIHKTAGLSGLTDLEKKLFTVNLELESGITTQEQAAAALNDLANGYKGSAENIGEFIKANEHAGAIAKETADKIKNSLEEMMGDSPELYGFDPDKNDELQQQLDKLHEGIKTSLIQGFADGLEEGLNVAFNGGSMRDKIPGIARNIAQDIASQIPVFGPIVSAIVGPIVQESFEGLAKIGKSTSETKAGIRKFLNYAMPTIAPGLGNVLDKTGLFDAIFGKGQTLGTTARKAVDAMFCDMFDANRVAVIINGQLAEIKDLVFKGNTLFGGNVGFSSSEADNMFSDYLLGLPETIKAAFIGVGTALEETLGISDEISGQIAAVLANNIGGSLNNLQLLINGLGLSAEQMSDAVVNAFMQGELSASEALAAIQGIQTVMEDGIPGATGAVEEAFDNIFAAGTKGGAALIDAIKDIGYEAHELGFTTLADVQKFLLSTGKYSAEQIQAVMDALAAAGIDSIDELVNATTEELLPALAQLENQGFLKETTQRLDDLIEKVNEMPDRIEKKLNFRIETTWDDRTQEAMRAGAFNAAGARVPDQRGL